MQKTVLHWKRIVPAYLHNLFVLSLVVSLFVSQGLLAQDIKRKETNQKGADSPTKHLQSKQFTQSVGGTETGVEDLKRVLQGLETLIAAEKKKSSRQELILKKASTLLALGKSYYLKGRSKSEVQWRDYYFNAAIRETRYLTEANDIPTTLRARALHAQGMVYVFQGKEAEAVEVFQKAMKTDPAGEKNPSLALFSAEYYFDKEKYDLALPLYSEYFNRYQQDEKALALYKSGWCFLFLKQYDSAEKAFLKIIGKQWAGDFAKDAQRDLAQVVTSYRDERGILEFGVREFKGALAPYLLGFYNDAYLLLIAQSGNIDRVELFNEIMRLEKSPEKKVALAVKRLSGHQKGYASHQVAEDLTLIENLIAQGGLKRESTGFQFFAQDLETEIIRAITAYVDTITKKVKSPEDLTMGDVATKLKKILWYHMTWFPQSSKMVRTYELALENCAFLKDPECSIVIGRTILKRPELGKLTLTAKLAILVGLEDLFSKDTKFTKQYLDELKRFSDSDRDTKEWLPVTKKLTQILIGQKAYALAEPYLVEILRREWSSENLYRLNMVYFEQKKYSQVIAYADKAPKEGSMVQELTMMIREASLALAREASERNDFTSYETNLKRYLVLQTDLTKADTARADYLSRLVERGDWHKAKGILEALPIPQRLNDVYRGVNENILALLASQNRFDEILSFLNGATNLKFVAPFEVYRFRALLLVNKEFTSVERLRWGQLASSQRQQLLTELAVTEPKRAIELIGLQSNNGLSEQKILAVAQGMLQGLPPEERENGMDLPPSSSSRLFSKIVFPEARWNSRKLEQHTPVAMEQVKRLRRLILKDLKENSTVGQEKLLFLGITAERRMGRFFDEVPAPNDFSIEEAKGYREEMNNFASEYFQQINEYQKILSKIQSLKQSASEKKLAIPTHLERWSRGRNGIFHTIEVELQRFSFTRALWILEAHRALGKISPLDYYRWRSFIILKQFPHEYASQYVFGELEVSGQTTIITEWQKLLGAVGSNGQKHSSRMAQEEV